MVTPQNPLPSVTSDDAAMQLMTDIEAVLSRHRQLLRLGKNSNISTSRDSHDAPQASKGGASSCQHQRNIEKTNGQELGENLGIVPVPGSIHHIDEDTIKDAVIKVTAADVAEVVTDTAEHAVGASTKTLNSPRGSLRGKTQTLNSPKAKKHADDYVLTSAQRNAKEFESWIERCVESNAFELASLFVILLNTAFIAMQTEHIATETLAGNYYGHSKHVGWKVCKVLFAFLFTLDLLLHWFVDGFIGFFKTTEYHWNMFDLLIVLGAIAEIIIDASQGEAYTASIITVLRVLRVIRVMRILKKLPMFRDLRIMVRSLIKSIKSLLWVVIIFFFIFLVFAMMFTLAVANHVKKGDLWKAEETENLRAYFGTLGRSMISLYMGITGGNDWGQYFEEVRTIHWIHATLYLLYVLFSIIAVLNVVTGIFVESAMGEAAEDTKEKIDRELQERKKGHRALRALFTEMDDNDSGQILQTEFEKHLDDPIAQAYFKSLDLEFDDPRALFHLLDTDGSGAINFEEFVAGCERLKGEAKALDIAMLFLNLRSQFKLQGNGPAPSREDG